MIRTLKSLGIVSSLGMLFILLGGALVTKTDSGAGCGESWPLCHGELIPSNITPELVIELSHRLVSSVMGITIVLLAVIDRKSTRLNSSHVASSYAVFCLKKKNT